MSQPDHIAASRVSILLVDDEPGILETLKDYFEDMGFHAEMATTGRQALRKIQDRFYNLALLDINLPDIQGTELLAEARRLRPEMKCIMVTGNTELTYAVKSVKEGAYWYLLKPIEVPYVEAVVRRALEQQRLALLAQGLVEHEGLEERLRLVTDSLTLVTEVSDCVIWLMSRDALVPAFHRNGVGDEPRRLAPLEIPLDEVFPPLRRILDSGRANVVPNVPHSGVFPESLVEHWEISTALLLPLQTGGRIIGLAALAEPAEQHQFSDDQIRQAQTIAYMAAVAIHQAQTIQEERDTLRTLVESFLTRPPVRDDISLASCYEPAVEVAQIGGDYYDFIELGEDRLGLVIGDVCGKGRAAAIYIAMAKYMLRAYAVENPSPQHVMTRLNQALYNQMSEECMFITMVYGVLELKTSTFTYTNAAHPPPILFHRESKELQELMPTGGMVGAIEEMEFGENTVSLEPGSVLALFTDGVTEARSGTEMLDSAGVQEVVRQHAEESADGIADAILDRAREFASGMLRDDVAIVVAKNG
jgi:serine phosphatase RsbU (regulator of sigma subunit)/DNA-binding response OmpR family regulator